MAPAKGPRAEAAAVSKVAKRKRPANDVPLDDGNRAGKAVKKGKAGKTAAATPDSPHPFDWDPADDCETSLEAYKDIAPLLTKLAQKLNKTKAELRIYDPYYCQGGPAKHLAKLGFTNVHNANEDFYARLDAGKLPAHDVLMTSPPYSADHICRLLQHASKATAPWVLLMPEYVHRKAYYAPAVAHLQPWFLLPTKAYTYFAVSGSRADNTHVACRHWKRAGSCPRGSACVFLHKKTEPAGASAAPVERVVASMPSGVNDAPTPVVPFHSFWHVHLGGGVKAESVMAWWQQKFGKKQGAMKLVRTAAQLPPPTNSHR